MAKEHRCTKCGKLLIRSDLIDTKMQCTRTSCKHVNVIRYISQSALLRLGLDFVR